VQCGKYRISAADSKGRHPQAASRGCHRIAVKQQI
jgi:hypothetical protein